MKENGPAVVPWVLEDETGQPFGRLAAGELYVPDNVGLEGEWLKWRSEAPYPAGGTTRAPDPRLLEEFIRIADGPSETILRFARKWGVLRICEHNLPISHFRFPIPVTRLTQLCGRWKKDSWFLEPLSTWKEVASSALGTLKIAGRLHEKEIGDQDDWKQALSWPPRPGLSKPPSRGKTKRFSRDEILEAERGLLAEIVEYWLLLGDVQPRLNWGFTNAAEPIFKDPEIALRGGGLFGALGTQLALAVAQTKGFAFCTNCGRDFSPEKRRPSVGRRRYCSRKGCKQASRRDAQRDYDHAKKLAKQQFVNGMTKTQIARELGRSLGTIQKWVGKTNRVEVRNQPVRPR